MEVFFELFWIGGGRKNAYQDRKRPVVSIEKASATNYESGGWKFESFRVRQASFSFDGYCGACVGNALRLLPWLFGFLRLLAIGIDLRHDG